MVRAFIVLNVTDTLSCQKKDTNFCILLPETLAVKMSFSYISIAKPTEVSVGFAESQKLCTLFR